MIILTLFIEKKIKQRKYQEEQQIEEVDKTFASIRFLKTNSSLVLEHIPDRLDHTDSFWILGPIQKSSAMLLTCVFTHASHSLQILLHLSQFFYSHQHTLHHVEHVQGHVQSLKPQSQNQTGQWRAIAHPCDPKAETHLNTGRRIQVRQLHVADCDGEQRVFCKRTREVVMSSSSLCKCNGTGSGTIIWPLALLFLVSWVFCSSIL